MTSQLLSNQTTSGAVQVWVRLLRGHAVARRSLTAQLHTEHRLTVNDYEALLLLSRADGNVMRRVDLADGLQLTASGVTRLLDGLERQGLVEKAVCTSDARVTYAKLTGPGLEKLEQASSSHIAAIQALFEEHFTSEELATLAELLGRLPGAGAADAGDCAA